MLPVAIVLIYVGRGSLLNCVTSIFPECQEATTTTAAETEEHGEPKEKEAVPKEDADQDKEKETPATEEAAGELPASTPASVA